MNIFIANTKKQNTDMLITLLQKIDKGITVLGNASSYEETIGFCNKHSLELDLLICGTQLQGETTSNILNQISDLNSIIFTAESKHEAYEAIKSNCIDFVLEPFDHNEIADALVKVKSVLKDKKGKSYKKRFIIKFGDKIQFRTVQNISYIFAEGKMAYIITRQPSRKYIIEYTLDELEKTQLDPSIFYRINRKFIVNIDSIEEARQYVNSRLKLVLNPPTDVDMIVSREKVNDFKKWLNL